MKEKGLTGFQLKIIGLLFMIFDHIGEFFSYTGAIPLAFNWVGRIVAPIFIFMTVEGYIHTRSKKKYMFRLYMGSLIMNIGNYFIPKYFQRTDSIAIMNNIFATLFMIIVYLCIIEFITKGFKEKSIIRIFIGGLLFLLPIALSIFFMLNIENFLYLIFIIPTPLFVEGGPIFIGIGIIMYLLIGDKKKLLIAYMAISLAIIFTGEISIQGLFFNNFQWMMVFATPLLYLYNGKRGKGMKYLFYVFYPAHIYIFYILSCYLMKK